MKTLENSAGSKRIAIVEDNRFMSQCMGLWLEQRFGYDIVGYAEDGEAGLKLCVDKRPDLVLLDIRLPKLD
ncbi:MAG: response regulator, partial [Verrucomicrobiota bacterium]